VCSQNPARRVRALQGRLEVATGNKRLARISDDANADGWFRRYRYTDSFSLPVFGGNYATGSRPIRKKECECLYAASCHV